MKLFSIQNAMRPIDYSVEERNYTNIPRVHCAFCGSDWIVLRGGFPTITPDMLAETAHLLEAKALDERQLAALAAEIRRFVGPAPCIRPGMSLGPTSAKLFGRKVPDLIFGLGYEIFVSLATFDALRRAGIEIAGAAPAKLRHRGADARLLELEVEMFHLLRTLEGGPSTVDCLACHRRSPGEVEPVVLRRRIPPRGDLFRTYEHPNLILTTERFRDAVERLGLTGVAFEEVEVVEDAAAAPDGLLDEPSGNGEWRWPRGLAATPPSVIAAGVVPVSATAAAGAALAGSSSPEKPSARRAGSGLPFTSELPLSDELPVGASRLGGAPDVPEGFAWPRRGERPLSFLAQFNLAEVHDHLPSVLPEAGLLAFYFDAEEQPWGFDPADRDGWVVVHHAPGAGELRRAVPPEDLDDDARHYACTVRFAPPHLRWRWAWPKRTPAAAGDDEPLHQLLGDPAPLQQHNMALDCALASNGVDLGTTSGYRDPRALALAEGADDWVLLLQLDTDDRAEFHWADGGRLYFWIRKHELGRGDFSGVWAIIQSG